MLIRLLFSHYLKNLTFHLTFSQFVLVDIRITRTRRHHNHHHHPSRFHYFCLKLQIVSPHWDPNETRKSFFSSAPMSTRGCFNEPFRHQAHLQFWILDLLPSPHFAVNPVAWHAFWGTFALGLRCLDLQPCLHTQICRLHSSLPLPLPPHPHLLLKHHPPAPLDRLIRYFGFFETQICRHHSHLKLCLTKRLEAALALFSKLFDFILALSDPCLLANGSCPCSGGQRLQQPAFLLLLRPQRWSVHPEFDLAVLANLDSCHLPLAPGADLMSFLGRPHPFLANRQS